MSTRKNTQRKKKRGTCESVFATYERKNEKEKPRRSAMKKRQ